MTFALLYKFEFGLELDPDAKQANDQLRELKGIAATLDSFREHSESEAARLLKDKLPDLHEKLEEEINDFPTEAKDGEDLCALQCISSRWIHFLSRVLIELDEGAFKHRELIDRGLCRMERAVPHDHVIESKYISNILKRIRKINRHLGLAQRASEGAQARASELAGRLLAALDQPDASH